MHMPQSFKKLDSVSALYILVLFTIFAVLFGAISGIAGILGLITSIIVFAATYMVSTYLLYKLVEQDKPKLWRVLAGIVTWVALSILYGSFRSEQTGSAILISMTILFPAFLIVTGYWLRRQHLSQNN